MWLKKYRYSRNVKRFQAKLFKKLEILIKLTFQLKSKTLKAYKNETEVHLLKLRGIDDVFKRERRPLPLFFKSI